MCVELCDASEWSADVKWPSVQCALALFTLFDSSWFWSYSKVKMKKLLSNRTRVGRMCSVQCTVYCCAGCPRVLAVSNKTNFLPFFRLTSHTAHNFCNLIFKQLIFETKEKNNRMEKIRKFIVTLSHTNSWEWVSSFAILLTTCSPNNKTKRNETKQKFNNCSHQKSCYCEHPIAKCFNYSNWCQN